MSLKKRMFRSDMAILFAAMLSVVLIILAVMVLFEDSLERQFYAAGEAGAEQNGGERSRSGTAISAKRLIIRARKNLSMFAGTSMIRSIRSWRTSCRRFPWTWTR